MFEAFRKWRRARVLRGAALPDTLWHEALGSLPFLIGLTVVMPLLGHATWHLYRKAVEPDLNPRKWLPRPEGPPRYAADFPAVLFEWLRNSRR